MKDHMRSLHLRIIEECQKCDYFTPDMSRLCLHMRSLHADSVKCCGSCYFATFDETSMLQHIESKHAGTSGCNVSNGDQGKGNGDVENEEGLVKCQLCVFISSEAGLTEHIVKCHVIC